jgi:hypothetical protein
VVELLGLYSKLSKLPDFTYAHARTQPEPVPRHIHDARRRLGPDVIAQLVHDYKSGQSTTALMSTYGLGKGAVLRLLEEAGVQRRCQGQRTSRSMKLSVSTERAGHSPTSQVTSTATVRLFGKPSMAAGVKLRPRNGWPPGGASRDQ